MGSRRLPVLVFLASVLLLAGCGHARDPFVGTWESKAVPGGNAAIDMVITKLDEDHYRVSAWPLGSKVYIKSGNGLFYDPGSASDAISALFDTGSSHLLIYNSDTRLNQWNPTFDCVKVSESTALPTQAP